jgi:hypothetical protein
VALHSRTDICHNNPISMFTRPGGPIPATSTEQIDALDAKTYTLAFRTTTQTTGVETRNSDAPVEYGAADEVQEQRHLAPLQLLVEGVALRQPSLLRGVGIVHALAQYGVLGHVPAPTGAARVPEYGPFVCVQTAFIH